MYMSDNTTPHPAVEYDKSVRQTIPYYEEIHSEVIDLVKTLTPKVNCWLDTGCGTGYLVKTALPHFPGTSFILADPSAAMLQQAMERFHSLPEQRVRYLRDVSSENLGLYQNKIHPQVVTAILSHHYLLQPQRREATLICYRLLDRGGVFITVENIRPGTQNEINVGLDRWKRFQIEHGRSKSDVEEHAKRFNSQYFPVSIEDHLDLLHEAGFKTVNLFWMSYMQAGFYAIK